MAHESERTGPIWRNTLKHEEENWLDDAEVDGVDSRGRAIPTPRRKVRRKPKSRRTAGELLAENAEGKASDEAVFADPDLEGLRKRGHIDELVGQVKGGKEATVYLMRRGDELLAAKVYADLESRSFRNDAAYWSGVHIADKRVERAIRSHSRTGRAAQHGIWVMREYANLWRLHEAGVPVPKPLIGPSAKECAEAGAVVLMEFIGEGELPAPRLSDVKLEPEEARPLLDQSIEILMQLARLGLVHGDFSAYNLLLHDGRVVLIDVPQILDVRSAETEAVQLLKRDVASLLSSFRRHRVEVDAAALERAAVAELKSRA